MENTLNLLLQPTIESGLTTTDVGILRITRSGTAGNDSLVGTTVNDVLSGLAGNDTLIGGAGNDTLNGGLGNDSLVGGLGNDSMVGGAGNDIYIVNSAGDRVVEALNQGIDTVFSSVNYTLPSNVENLTLQGTAAQGIGNTLNNRLIGNQNDNQLVDTNGNDILNGNAGNDGLVGGVGQDTLTGGSGIDSFTFFAINQIGDRITDFTSGGDALVISAPGFGGGLVAGGLFSPIASSQFVAGGAARDANDRFIYNRTAGTLFFDSDGTGATAQVRIATFNAGLDLKFSDIFLSSV
jgi:Ca2+-binding RTX toxin-like protein